ncbi:MAG: hypothetical protein C0631_05180 [Sedimenticola sp.]|mgnify:CR=1 FL=1|nr:MAG: hypothetical protein C0631_05180 [Sedimenticola sp.]
MKKIHFVLPLLIALTGCSMEDPETGEKTSLGKAAEHAKEAAKNLGNAVSETTEEVDKKWTDMNKDRIQSDSRENSALPQVEGDTEQLKQTLQQTRQTVVDATKAAVDKAKSLGNSAETESKE